MIGYGCFTKLEVLRNVSVPDEDAHESPLQSRWMVVVVVVSERISGHVQERS